MRTPKKITPGQASCGAVDPAFGSIQRDRCDFCIQCPFGRSGIVCLLAAMPRRGPCLGELLVGAPNRASNTTASTWIRERQGNQLSAHAAVPATDVRRGYRCVGALQPYQRRGYRRAGSQPYQCRSEPTPAPAAQRLRLLLFGEPCFRRAACHAAARPDRAANSERSMSCLALPCLALLCFALLGLGSLPLLPILRNRPEKPKRLEFQAPSSRRLERRPSRFRDRARLSLEISTHSHFAPILLGSWLDSSGKCAYAVRRVLVG